MKRTGFFLCCDLMQQQQQQRRHTILFQHSCTRHILRMCECVFVLVHNQHQFSYPMQNNCSCFLLFSYFLQLQLLLLLNTFRMYVIWAILFSRCVQKSSYIVLTDKMLSFPIQCNYQVDSFRKYVCPLVLREASLCSRFCFTFYFCSADEYVNCQLAHIRMLAS